MSNFTGSEQPVANDFAPAGFNDMREVVFIPKHQTAQEAIVNPITQVDGDQSDPVETELAQQLSKKYEDGFADGRRSAEQEYDAVQNHGALLAKAIAEFDSADTEELTRLYWVTLRQLLIESVGETGVDKDLLESRCVEAVEKLGGLSENLVLCVSNSDQEYIRESNPQIEIEVDPSLPAGSIRMIHPDRELLSGTAAVIHQLDAEINKAADKSC